MSRLVASASAPYTRSKSGGAICIDTTIRLYHGASQAASAEAPYGTLGLLSNRSRISHLLPNIWLPCDETSLTRVDRTSLSVGVWFGSVEGLLVPPLVIVCRCSVRSRSFLRWGAPP